MEITAGQNRRITSSTLNIILNKKYLKKAKQANVTMGVGFKQIGYHNNTLVGASRALIKKEIKRSNELVYRSWKSIKKSKRTYLWGFEIGEGWKFGEFVKIALIGYSLMEDSNASIPTP